MSLVGDRGTMKAIGNVSVWEVFEGHEVGVDDASELDRVDLLPAEGLAGGEGEGQAKL